ncbi:hypothetical protein ASD31_05015 [Rhizobium sp. Root482]|nr:hypothetical protein ASD31_05015 [Rhizobium sp. Root482]
METSMADVIRIEDRLVRAPPKTGTQPAVHGDAVILMFTGIRYERLDDHPGGNPATPLRSKSKKH